MSEPIVLDTYALSTNVEAKIHSAGLVLKAIDLLILDNVGPETPIEDLKGLLKIVGQLVNATATYVQEAYDEAGNVSAILSRAH